MRMICFCWDYIKSLLAKQELSPVRLYIWKMHPDGLSRCLIQMLHLGVVRFFISSMHPDESSECNYVRLLFIF
ncbi:hypothetical protein YC2023_102670 [Brassica napus]